MIVQKTLLLYILQVFVMNNSKFITLNQRIDAAIALIRRGERTALRYQPVTGYNVAFSGGKDSQVVLELVKMSGVRYQAVHHITSIDAPQTMRFIREQYPDVIMQRPPRTFQKICLDARMLPSRWVRFCCQFLKERGGESTFTVTGVRHAESYKRQSRQEVEIMTRRRHPEFVAGTYDQFAEHQLVEQQCIRGKDKLILNPILDWSDSEVWQFIADRRLPVNPLYRTCARVGCVFCPLASVNARRRELQLFPRYVPMFIRLIHQIRELRRQDGAEDAWGTLTDEQVFYDFYIAQKKLDSLK